MTRKYLNRIISLVVCTVLLIVSLILLYEKNAYSIGKGNGKSATVSTMEELNDVLKSVSYLSENNGFPEGGADGLIKHNSVTVTETTDFRSVMYKEESAKSKTAHARATVSLQRMLVMCYTESEVVYRSAGKIIMAEEIYDSTSLGTTSISTKIENNSAINFAVDVYINTEKVLIKIGQWDYDYYYKSERQYNDINETETKTEADDETYQLIKELTGKWIDCTPVPEFAETLLSLNTENVNVLNTISSIINAHVTHANEGLFKKNNEKYELSQDYLPMLAQQLTEELSTVINVKGSLIADLSDKNMPTIFETLKCIGGESKENDETGEKSKNSISIYIDDKLAFSNIGNTVVKDKNIAATDIRTLFVS